MHKRNWAGLPVLGLGFLVLGLAACGGSGSADSNPSAGQPSNPPPVAPPPAPSPSVTASTNTVSATIDRNLAAPVASLTLTLKDTTTNNISLFGDFTKYGIDHITAQAPSTTQLVIRFYYRTPKSLTNGTYSDSGALYVCTDDSCSVQISGSPLYVTSTYTVTGTDTGTGSGPPPAGDPVGTPLTPRRRITLSHNVRDAEYSRALDRVVMVASYPGNALYVYDVATDTEKSVPLNKPPTSVSIAPDGLSAAVGHDALITIIDLTTAGQAGAPAPILLNVSADVFDLVLDGHRKVHVFPRIDQWVNPHSIDIATNTETIGSFGLRAGSHARLHPSGDFVYSADNGLSPSDIHKWDITSGVAMGLYDSRYHGEYSMCGDLWYNQSGSRIYTRCGNSFSSDVAKELDMTYTGKLALSANTAYGSSFGVVWLDHFAPLKEIALVESNQPYGCGTAAPNDPCYTHLGTFDSDFLTQKAVYSIAPVSVNGTSYQQRGLFVFYRSDGTSKYLLSRLEAMPNPDAEYYLSVLD